MELKIYQPQHSAMGQPFFGHIENYTVSNLSLSSNKRVTNNYVKTIYRKIVRLNIEKYYISTVLTIIAWIKKHNCQLIFILVRLKILC